MINKSFRWKVITDKGHLKEPIIQDYSSTVHLNNDSNFESEEEAMKALENLNRGSDYCYIELMLVTFYDIQ